MAPLSPFVAQARHVPGFDQDRGTLFAPGTVVEHVAMAGNARATLEIVYAVEQYADLDRSLFVKIATEFGMFEPRPFQYVRVEDRTGAKSHQFATGHVFAPVAQVLNAGCQTILGVDALYQRVRFELNSLVEIDVPH